MKEQLDYVQFDVDFLTKPKIVAIRFRYGAEGLLAYMQILFALGRATNAEITEDAFYGLMQLSGFSAEKATEMLGYFLTAEVLTRKQNGALTNSRIAEDQANVGQKRDKWRDNKRKQRGQVEDNSVDVPMDSEDHEHYEDHEDLNLEKKGSGEEKPFDWCETIPILTGLPEAETRKAIKTWRDYCQKRGKSFDQGQAEAAMLNGKHLAERFPEAIRRSIQNGWKNLGYDLPEKPGAPPKRKLTATEQGLQNAVELLQEIRGQRGT